MPRWLLLAPMPVMTAWTRAPRARARLSRSMTIMPPPSPRTIPSLSASKGREVFAGGPFLPRQPVQCAQGGEFQEMQMGEIILAPADDGGIDDAVSDHLEGAVKRDQGGGAGGGDRIAGPHEAIAVADEAGRGAVEPAQKRGVVRGHASGPHLPFDGALLIRREVNGPLDRADDIMNVRPDDHIGEGARRLSRVLGDEDRDPLARDA